MLGTRITLGKKLKDEAEKPFWISFADLMTALMVMFLLVMSVALLAVTKTVSEEQRAADARKVAIEKLLDEVEQIAKNNPQFSGIHVNRDSQTINFGDRARFDTASHQLNLEQARLLRAYIPHVLAIADSDLGKDWLKRIVVEGFADKRGSYLLNLNLSLQRSERVLCVLLAKADFSETELSFGQREEIRQLFLVGGYSSNSQKDTLEESRRIELRLEFRGIKELSRIANPTTEEDFGLCTLK